MNLDVLRCLAPRERRCALLLALAPLPAALALTASATHVIPPRPCTGYPEMLPLGDVSAAGVGSLPVVERPVQIDEDISSSSFDHFYSRKGTGTWTLGPFRLHEDWADTSLYGAMGPQNGTLWLESAHGPWSAFHLTIREEDRTAPSAVFDTRYDSRTDIHWLVVNAYGLQMPVGSALEFEMKPAGGMSHGYSGYAIPYRIGYHAGGHSPLSPTVRGGVIVLVAAAIVIYVRAAMTRPPPAPPEDPHPYRRHDLDDGGEAQRRTIRVWRMVLLSTLLSLAAAILAVPLFHD